MSDKQTKTPPADPIASALEAFRAGDRSAALAMLLERWRKTRAKELADLIDLVGAQLTDTRPVVGKNRSELQASWTAIEWSAFEANRRAADLGPLLATLPRVQAKVARDMLAKLLEWPADPRTAEPLLKLIAGPPRGFQGSGAGGFWQRLATLLGRTADPRALDAIEDLLQRESATDDWSNLSGFLQAGLQRAAKATRQAADKAKPLSETEQKSCAAFTAALAKPTADRKTIEELLAEVLAAPEQTDLRLVLADALQEAGDPRGEFIMLQMQALGDQPLTAAQKRRESQLRRKHSRQWLGELAPVLLETGLVFEGGFVAEAKLSCPLERQARELLGSPEWSTIRRLIVSEWPLPLPELAHSGLRSLERLEIRRQMHDADEIAKAREALAKLPQEPRLVIKR